MEDFVKIITHARRFKSAVKGLSVAQLEEVKGKLENIIRDREKELEKEKERNARKLEKIAKYKKMMADDGLDLDDFQGAFASQKKGARPAKYEIYVNGKHTTWSGQGRMPNVFKEQIKAGKSIDDYLIG